MLRSVCLRQKAALPNLVGWLSGDRIFVGGAFPPAVIPKTASRRVELFNSLCHFLTTPNASKFATQCPKTQDRPCECGPVSQNASAIRWTACFLLRGACQRRCAVLLRGSSPAAVELGAAREKVRVLRPLLQQRL